MKKVILLILTIISVSAYAGKKPLIEDYDKVVAAAKAEIEKSLQAPEGELFLFAQAKGISGTFSFDITIHEKGLVATVFVVSNEAGTIKSQNNLKDFVKAMKFNFKMPKGKDYKFNYVFNFNQ
ncbi:MAG TPA: hypothetical protein P5514_13390 [Bacteroidales bacterium]|nr:hypothetical protein [Bacteroidales bacterium]HPE57257.1 hypothetical protein [Bacteroidales bacterium]HRX97936.1 hypothetical protein [Bacteroidales bacterium]